MSVVQQSKPKKILGFLNVRKDHILLFLAIFILIAGLVGTVVGLSSKMTPIPVMVFTQWLENELEPGILEGLVREYEENTGGIKIELEFISHNEARNRLLNFDYDGFTAGSVESPGDILIFDGAWIGELFRSGVLDPADDPPEPFLGYFYPLFYNIELLKESGFNRPPKTRGEFLEMAQAAANPEAGVYGIAFALGTQNPSGMYCDIYPWFWASDVTLHGNDRPFRETLDFLSRLNQGNMVFPGTFAMSDDEKLEAFTGNKIAFMISRMQDTRIVRQKMGDAAFGISTVPAADSYLGKPVFGAASWHLGVFSRSEHRERAEAFVAFLMEKSSFIAEKTNAICGNSLSPRQMNDPFISKAWELYVDGFMANPAVPDMDEGYLSVIDRDEIFREELASLFERGGDPVSAASAINNRWKAAVQR